MLSEQCQVLMVAKTLDYNLDLANHLQMQDAMNAYIALQPSSSRCPPPKPQPDNVISSLDDNFLDVAATIMLQGAKRFAQDQKQSEAKMRKMLEDLDRRIHDQNFTTYILNIPREE